MTPLATDASAGHWLRDALNPAGNTVDSFVPAGCDFYARILNPVVLEGFGQPAPRLAWSEAAARVGAPVRPWMQWHETVLAAAENLPPEWVSPAMGDLDKYVARALVEVLGEHTGTPDECFFAQWDGYAPLTGNKGLVTFPPDREMKVFAGPLGDGALRLDGLARPSSAAHGGRRALRWWPQDRAWCVGQDIYARSVLVGASRACLKQLFAHPALDIFSVRAGDAVFPEDA